MVTLARFLLVGLINTGIGYGVIVALMMAGVGDYGANALGYLVGFVISFFLNRKFTFEAKTMPSFREALRFSAACAVAYIVNLAVLTGGRVMIGNGSTLVQAVAVAAYAATFFVLGRHFVFVDPADDRALMHETGSYERGKARRWSRER